MRKFITFVGLALLLIIFTLPVAAQDGNVIVDGLNNPRALDFDDNGVLWIGEAGTGGEYVAPGDFAPVNYGGTARVLALAPGSDEAEVVIGALPSAQGFNDLIGVNSIHAEFGGIWLVLGAGPLAHPFNNALVQLDQETLRVGSYIDVYTFEAQNNPDNEDVQANANDVAVSDTDTFYIIDASGNSLLTWTVNEGLQLFHAWTDLPVPTSVDVAADGSVYVGFLSAFPFAPGSAKIEHWSPEGELIHTYEGLTGVTDVLVADDGTIYAVELSTQFGDTGWVADAGRVVTVSESGITPIAEGLNFPYRLAMSADGGLVVTVNSAFSEPGSGQVIALSGEFATMSSDDMGGEGGEVEPPAETPEPGA